MAGSIIATTFGYMVRKPAGYAGRMNSSIDRTIPVAGTAATSAMPPRLRNAVRGDLSRNR